VVRLITWNVARRVSALAEQAAAVGEREPDVLALQEVTARTLPLWEAACAAVGLGHVACTLGAADPARVPAGPRRTGVLLAAREPLEPLPEPLGVPWPESALAARLGGIELHADAFRALHGYGEREPSWVWPQHRGGWRLDHVFCSAELEPVACAYHHDWRDAGLSDHSALEADLAYEPGSGP
jgi:exonuclease III